MADVLRIRADGTAILEAGSGAPEPGREGRWQLLAAPERLLIGLGHETRTPVNGRVVLAGDLQAIPFPDVVTLVVQSRLTGTLRVFGRHGERALVFLDGEVRGATSSRPGDRLGQIMVHDGMISAEQLGPILSEPSAGRRLGRLLVERGHITANQLWAAIRKQVSLVFQGILLETTAAFVLSQGGEQPLITPGLQAQSLLLDGLRQLDELGLLREPIPPDAIVRAAAVPEVSITGDQRELLRRLERGVATPAKLSEELGLSPVDVLRALRQLSQAGFVSIAHEERPAGFGQVRAPEALPPIVRVFNQIFREVTAEAGGHGAAEAAAGVFLAALADPARHGLFTGLTPDGDGALDEARLLARLPACAVAAGQQPQDFLLDALQQVMFALLFGVGERLTTEANEQLTRKVKLLFGMLEE